MAAAAGDLALTIGFDFSNVASYIAVVVPIAINSLVETIMCVESAALAGDNYPLAETAMVDGFGTVLGAFFGCPFPTTVPPRRASHPVWPKVLRFPRVLATKNCGRKT